MTGVGSMQQGAIKARKGTELGNAQEIQCDRAEAAWQGGGAGSVFRSHQARWLSVNAILRKSALYFCLRCEALAAPKPPRNRECPSSSPRRALSVSLLAAASEALMRIFAAAEVFRRAGIAMMRQIVQHERMSAARK